MNRVHTWTDRDYLASGRLVPEASYPPTTFKWNLEMVRPSSRYPSDRVPGRSAGQPGCCTTRLPVLIDLVRVVRPHVFFNCPDPLY